MANKKGPRPRARPVIGRKRPGWASSRYVAGRRAARLLAAVHHKFFVVRYSISRRGTGGRGGRSLLNSQAEPCMPNTVPCALLVEDEPLIRMLTVDMLDVLGFAAIEAANGAEALAVDDAALKTLAVLMIDLGLPDGPGEEVARKLRERRPDLPVILTTGADATAARAALSGAGTGGGLENPYQRKDLSRAL